MDFYSVVTLIGLAGLFICGVIGLIKRTYQPQPYSFLIFVVSGAIALYYMFQNDSLLAPMLTQSISLIWNVSMMIAGFILVSRQSIHYHITGLDYVLVALALIGLIIYQLVDNLTLSSLINAAAGLAAPALNVKKIWQAPQTEPLIMNFFSLIAWGINIFRVQNFNDFLLFGIWGVTNLTVTLILVFRRYIYPPRNLSPLSSKSDGDKIAKNNKNLI